MKVILMKDVRALGRAYDTLEVADGHALNFLIPKKLAIPATSSALRATEARRAAAEAEREVREQLITQMLETLAEERIVIRMKANEKGHLYDAVGIPEIRDALKEQARVELPADVIRLERPLKEVGTYDIPVAAGKNFGKFSLTIEAEP